MYQIVPRIVPYEEPAPSPARRMPATTDVASDTYQDMGEILVLMVKEAMWLAAAIKAASIVIIDLGDLRDLPPHYSLFCFSVSFGEARETVVLFSEIYICIYIRQSQECFFLCNLYNGGFRFAVGKPYFSAAPRSESTVTW